MDMVLQMWRFLGARRKFWLLPIIIVTVLIGGLLILAQGSVVGPFIFTLFLMKILGISAYYHDPPPALLIDGQVAAAAQEERFTRKKHDSSFPHHAIASCLQATGA